ncbi:hypothetical protein CISIN_1g035387mg [Citrus sinensis]|uniref:Uncharacterized protein n=1 Tax=Citrus sinensis TaxID=2711 RepID=A0A067DFH6_CITSI|nr:hypothetical protein CISIN_1g035387mg [Citrus sinensis]
MRSMRGDSITYRPLELVLIKGYGLMAMMCRIISRNGVMKTNRCCVGMEENECPAAPLTKDGLGFEL